MKTRRDILKIGLAATTGLYFSNPLLASDTSTSFDNHRSVPKCSAIAWRRTIFCQFEHDGLANRLNEWAQVSGCRCWYASKNDSSDCFAIGSFVYIIDRKCMGLNNWNEFVSFQKETCDGTPCLIVDNIKGLPVTGTNYFLQFDLKQRKSIADIIHIVHEMRNQMDKNLPEQFQRMKVPSVQKTEPIYSVEKGWGIRTYWDWS